MVRQNLNVLHTSGYWNKCQENVNIHLVPSNHAQAIKCCTRIIYDCWTLIDVLISVLGTPAKSSATIINIVTNVVISTVVASLDLY